MRLAWIVDLDDAGLRDAVGRLRAVLFAAGLEEADPRDADVTVVWADRPLPRELTRTLSRPGTRGRPRRADAHGGRP